MIAILPRNKEELNLCKKITEFNDIIAVPQQGLEIFKEGNIIKIYEDKIICKYRKREKNEKIIYASSYIARCGYKYFKQEIKYLERDKKVLKESIITELKVSAALIKEIKNNKIERKIKLTVLFIIGFLLGFSIYSIF